jgi:putative ABC transport system permease protein
MPGRIASFFRNLLRKRAVEQALDDELQSAVELLAQEKMKQGLSHREARRQALIELGGVEQVKEEVRAIRSGMFLETFAQDLRYGLRGLLANPGFSALAMLTLALGIGSATTIFSAIQNILLDPFPYTDAQRVVEIQIHDTASGRPGGRTYFQAPEFLDYQEQNHVFEEVIGGTFVDVLYYNGDGMERFQGAYVTPNTFRFLGVPALLGRGIAPDDARPGAPPVFVMAYKLWIKRFDQDRSILGKTFVLNDVPTTLVGIMPQRFTKLGAEVWMAKTMNRSDPQGSRDYWNFQAKLKRGVTIQQAQADIEVIAQRLAQVYSKNYPKNFSVQIISWVDFALEANSGSSAGRFRKSLYTIAAAVALLLLIACSNVVNMLLARATTREKEMAIRSSLGASRLRLLGQLLIESFLLALAGAIVGCLFSYAGIKGLVALIPDGLIPREAQIRLNLPVLLFSLGTAVFTAVLVGLVPALQAARKNLVEPLRDAGKAVSGGFRRGRLRSTLVVVEVALSVVLLSGAGLLMRSFVRLQQVDLGFNPDNILFVRLPFPRGQYKTVAEKQRFFRALLPRLQALPGVVAASETTTVPPFGGIRSDIEITGKTHAEKWEAIFSLCSEGYVPTLQVRLLRGRTFSEMEVNSARKVAVVNQTLVNKFFGHEDPIGKLVKINMLENLPDSPVKDPVFEIIGVISDARNQGLRDPAMPEVLVPFTITGTFDRAILVRTSVPPMTLLNNIQREIWAVDRNIALSSAGSLQGYMMQFMYAEPRFSVILLGVFAGVGLVMVAIGVFSVIAYTVSLQTHEIGIRMALGAGRADVLWMVLRAGLQSLGMGVGVGLLVSFGVTSVIASQLLGVSPRDPVTLGSVVAVVAVVGLAACYFPARRGTRIDPIVALRFE